MTRRGCGCISEIECEVFCALLLDTTPILVVNEAGGGGGGGGGVSSAVGLKLP